MKKSITPQEVVNYVNNHTTVNLKNPEQIMHEVLVAEYAVAHYFFNIGRMEATLCIDCSDLEEVFEENGNIYLQTKDGAWVLHAEEEAFDFQPNEKEMLKPYELTYCLKRARKLEAYLNDQLYLFKLDSAMVCVDFKMGVNSVCGPRHFKREFPSEPTFDYYFEIRVENPHNGVIYAKDMRQDIDTTNEEAFRLLARDLLKKLLPADIALFVDAKCSDNTGDE